MAFSLWPLRKRSTQPVTTGTAQRRAAMPQGGPMLPTVIGTVGAYNFHEGDIFTPGANNWVFDMPFEQPVFSPWGGGGGDQGVYRMANTFKTQQPPQVWVNQVQYTNGLGGLQAGQFVGQPLLNDTSEGGT